MPQTRSVLRQHAWLAAHHFVEPGVIEQDVFHAALHGGRNECLRAHYRAGVQHARNRVQQSGFQVERIGELSLLLFVAYPVSCF